MSSNTSLPKLIAFAMSIFAISTGAAPAEISNSGLVGPLDTIPDVQHGLEKRFNLGFYTKLLTSTGAIANYGCNPVVPVTIKAAACGMAVIGNIAGAIQEHYVSEKRDAWNDAPRKIYLGHYVEGQTATQTMNQQYSGTPLLISYDDCFGPGCFVVHYQNHLDKNGAIVHHLSVKPRHNGTAIGKRQSDESLSQTANADNDTNQSDEIFGNYYYRDVDESTEKGLAQGFTSGGFNGDAAAYADKEEFTNEGYHCFNIIDTDQNKVATTGYVTIGQGAALNAGDEDHMIGECQTMTGSS